MNQPTKRILQGILWITLYLALTLASLFLLLVGPTPPGRGFWREFSVALGFAGLAMMCLQEVFICGPQPMMDAVERALIGLGVAVGDIHTERFDLV